MDTKKMDARMRQLALTKRAQLPTVETLTTKMPAYHSVGPRCRATPYCRPERRPKTEQGTATFTYGKLRNAPCRTPEQPMRGTAAGQDYTIVTHPDPERRSTIVLTLDGHGAGGELYAVIAGEYIAEKLENNWSSIVEYSSKGFEESGGRAFAVKLFADADQHCHEELASQYSGGTTATVCMIINRQHCVTLNVGDTPAMLIQEDGSFEMLTASHSADSEEEYTRYCAHCSKLGVKPASFVYSRFNCDGGPRLPGPDGNFRPIPIFALENERPVPIEANCEYVASLGYHGGIQTVRKHVVTDDTGKAIGTVREKRHCNWGSTVGGGPQNTRTLGDFGEKELLHLDAEPSISVATIDRRRGMCWLIVATDGVTDAHWFEDIAKQVVQRAVDEGKCDAQDLCSGLIQDTLQNARGEKWPFKQDMNKAGDRVEYPAWDDLSVTLIAFRALENCAADDSESQLGHGPIRSVKELRSA